MQLNSASICGKILEIKGKFIVGLVHVLVTSKRSYDLFYLQKLKEWRYPK